MKGVFLSQNKENLNAYLLFSGWNPLARTDGTVRMRMIIFRSKFQSVLRGWCDQC